MQAHMKTLPIRDVALMVLRGARFIVPIYVIPREVPQLEEMSYNEEDTLSVEEVFGNLFKERGEPAVLLAGLRHREGLTQREFSKILNVTQANLSAMENGRRGIGKGLAKRIATKFKLDYRIFL